MHSSVLTIIAAGLFAAGAGAAEPLPVAGSVTSSAPASAGSLLDSEPLGAYGQPAWVKNRRFATTRVHIQRDPYEIAVEQWWRGRLNNGEWSHRFQEEVEIGLPGRIQLDFYYDWTYDDELGAEHLDYAAEIRWGLADWGEIWGNPALYFEYKWTDSDRGGDVIEPKILLGDEFGDGWQWGLNLVYEGELGGEHTEEWQVTYGLSKTLIESTLSAGLEAKYVHETVEGSRGSPEHKVLVGPSLQWRPTARSHVDLVALAGCTEDSPDLEAWVVCGFEFGPGGEKHANAPVSGRR